MNDHRKPLAEIRLAVDDVIFTVEDGALKVLLVRRSDEPFKHKLALPGGFLWQNETSREAAARILHDKGGVEGVFIEQLFTFDDPARDPRSRVITVTHYALVPRQDLVVHPSSTTEEPALYSTDGLKDLAFDHQSIVEYAVRRLRAKITYTNAAYSLLPPQFTFTDLQRLYETVLGTELDKRNFRKKVLSLGIIEPTGQISEGGRHRPAQYYRFVTTTPLELPESIF